ncbi:TPA: glycosyltransferase [Candidatus Woesearchaeota archaeon]|nr:glycogen/starch synthase [Candidatus Woesearchaeota archaeon]HIH31454.1 glycosyltransferase [Candidatus Woesearchaeota archaeon]HIH54240.1 glycosyltransferase [Candidatus Woesearchaeota archaeon]HIJ02623.1 glycosyltransferase [Candidatus Woesearchaeota archaeon]HIJ14553.1 glycosyltransferase [Candidatus Woesearchaeota archaeon]
MSTYLFESSWEVCNKVGGIYTVIKSKASTMMSLYQNYFLIGPYFEHNAKIDFISLEIPKEFKNAFQELEHEGIKCYYGKWLDVNGYCILIDFNAIINKKNEFKAKLWEDYGIDSLRASWDFEEPMLWSIAAGKVIENIYQNNPSLKIIAHCHEWLAGFEILYLKKYCPKISTVFTTHATVLGRTISSKGRDLYAVMNNIDVSREIYYNMVEAKHLAEKAAALNADVFTTVSDITAMESEKFLGRKPEFILQNGLDLEKFPTIEEVTIKHITSRDKIREFLIYYFFPYYVFDVNKNLVFYTVGRYEFRNKGYDVLIKALGRLNQILKNEKSDVSISVFFWIPMENHGIKLDVLENKNYYMHIKNYVMSNSPEILKKIVYDFICKKDVNQLFTDTFLKEIKKDLAAFERKGDPPLSTHNLEDNNLILSALRSNGLLNNISDNVKVIIEPIYLDGTDGFIDLSYYDAMIGCHLGIFLSYYEPYGYTPLESAALGVPAITTDMSGFGKFIKSKNPENKGIYVLNRSGINEEDFIKNFVQILYDYSKQPHSQRVNCKIKAKYLSTFADWKVLGENYANAHKKALEKNNDNNP